MTTNIEFINIINKHSSDFYPVVLFDHAKDKLAKLDLSENNPALTPDVYSNAEKLGLFIEEQKRMSAATYLIGGYAERRNIYRRSQLFDKNIIIDSSIEEDEPRSLHLGIDIWAEAGTPVYAPLGGMIHSFAFNNHFGDYGATIILQHQLETINFYTLYGHLSLRDLDCREGQFITRGHKFAHFGSWDENGSWPPHLHFQIILEIDEYHGDYPGVCKPGEASKYLKNCPDPNLILNMPPF